MISEWSAGETTAVGEPRPTAAGRVQQPQFAQQPVARGGAASRLGGLVMMGGCRCYCARQCTVQPHALCIRHGASSRLHAALPRCALGAWSLCKCDRPSHAAVQVRAWAWHSACLASCWGVEPSQSTGAQMRVPCHLEVADR